MLLLLLHLVLLLLRRRRLLLRLVLGLLHLLLLLVLRLVEHERLERVGRVAHAVPELRRCSRSGALRQLRLEVGRHLRLRGLHVLDVLLLRRREVRVRRRLLAAVVLRVLRRLLSSGARLAVAAMHLEARTASLVGTRRGRRKVVLLLREQALLLVLAVRRVVAHLTVACGERIRGAARSVSLRTTAVGLVGLAVSFLLVRLAPVVLVGPSKLKLAFVHSASCSAKLPCASSPASSSPPAPARLPAVGAGPPMSEPKPSSPPSRLSVRPRAPWALDEPLAFAPAGELAGGEANWLRPKRKLDGSSNGMLAMDPAAEAGRKGAGADTGCGRRRGGSEGSARP
jgi:hypothetical protein